jgi:hypothetical protein
MEKLIELMNEYAHTYADHYDDTWEEITITYLSHADECFLYKEADSDWIKTLVDDVVISKRFWFIAWLVENKKFKEYEALWDYLNNIKYIQFENWMVIQNINWSLYDSILGYLAISDTPIIDLFLLLSNE